MSKDSDRKDDSHEENHYDQDAGLPVLRQGAQAVEELRAEQPAYAGVEIEIIDENEQPELAKAYAKDYYYVPSLFIEGHKVYEAQPGQDYDTIKAAVVDAFEQAK